MNFATTRPTGKFQTLSALALMLGLSACGSTPTHTTSRAVIAPPPVETKAQEIATTPESLIETAKIAWQNNQSEPEVVSQLLTAADAYRAEEQCDKTLALLKAIKDTFSVPPSAHFNLLLVECAEENAIDNKTRIELLQSVTSDTNLRARQQQMLAAAYANAGQYVNAAGTLALGQALSSEANHAIWQWLNRASLEERTQAFDNSPQLRPWLAVIAMLRNYGDQPQRLLATFQAFSQQHPSHPIVMEPPAELASGVQVQQQVPQKVAVILPFTGRLSAQANAIKQGLLAAYMQQKQPNGAFAEPIELLFFDTAEVNPEVAATALADVDIVIGPLLREEIIRVQGLLGPQTQLLALNRVTDVLDNAVVPSPAPPIENDESRVVSETTNTISPDIKPHYFFALAPEDEAQQLAQHVFAQGYRFPIMVHAQDTINQRMAAAFLAKWRELNGLTENQGITIVSYDSINSMREGVGAALDVEQSKERIKTLERILIPELYNVPRNRRDIDAIVAFSSPDQTELLNPVIEASLSPFTDKDVPVYVTSRSIRFDSSKNLLRDLQNIHFIDMPWMMPNNQWQALSNEYTALYPNQRESLKRLFALGFDAYQQMTNMPHMAVVPQLSKQSLSGTLHLNEAHEVVRELPLAVIDNEQVRVIASPR
ncbi:penicillin-binding protein activator [Alteromonas facilis]|uniref:penicillin-binding protein activator n=1 Tax=Alteromonas facilis TaxID=2048004 RepID=UPI0013DA8DE5|nr:penicillin-binding protein activator [Alteromonas facilis]